MKEVTIIVPIYKVEAYLRTCFDSLLHQTCRNFIVFSVNDGSPDHAQEIIDAYASAYPQWIRGIKKENGGYGSVLQMAIQMMDTPYFLVCDADDSLKENALEELLTMAKMADSDITIGARTLLYEGSEKREYDPCYNRAFGVLLTNKVYHTQDKDADMLWFINPSPHAKLYKTELARSISFPTHVGYTDNMLFYLSLLRAKRVIYTDHPLANYLIDRLGNTMTDIRAASLHAQIRVFKSILDQAEAIAEVSDMFWYRMFETFRCLLYQLPLLDTDAAGFEAAAGDLETFLCRLLTHGKSIRKRDWQYAKGGGIVKMNDLLLLQKSLEPFAYRRLTNKMRRSFEKRDQRGERWK